jgi:hypothetical protein
MPFLPSADNHHFCSTKCYQAHRYLPTEIAVQILKNVEFASRNRDKSLGFDGRYGGAENSAYRVAPVAF